VAHPKLGQHFLIRGAVSERIAAAACPARAEVVIEVGPGRGALTEKLLKRAGRVVAIELDPYLAEHLRQRFAGESRLEIVEADVLEMDWSRWGSATVTGNLPYYIASPIMEKTVRSAAARAVFLIQKEVADRLVACPGRREYGFLTVEIAVFAKARKLFEVKPTAFHPPPKVDSAVVVLEPRERPSELEEPAAFLRLVSQAFRHKRKTLRNNLAEIYGKETLETWPEAGLRAEQVSLDGFVEMYRRLKSIRAL
jgi:16S rRNA (adenine1518-N6/adenine1519-N6)-dimethyltransferase